MLGIMTPWQEEQSRKFGGVQSQGPQPAAAPQPHIESYHMVLKAFDLKGKKRLASRTLPWLIVNMTTTVVGRH